MIILRNKNFSDKERKRKGEAAAMIVGGSSIAVGSHKLGGKVIDGGGKYVINSELTAKDKDKEKGN